MAQEQHIVTISTNDHEGNFCYDPEDDAMELTINDPFELFLQVDDKRFRFDIKKDGSLGIHLMNGVDCKITNPPAYSYPSPYIVLG